MAHKICYLNVARKFLTAILDAHFHVRFYNDVISFLELTISAPRAIRFLRNGVWFGGWRICSSTKRFALPLSCFNKNPNASTSILEVSENRPEFWFASLRRRKYHYFETVTEKAPKKLYDKNIGLYWWIRNVVNFNRYSNDGVPR